METIQLRKTDAVRLRSLLAAEQRRAWDGEDHELLHEEIDRAAILDDDALPAGVVAIGSTVSVLDLQSGARDVYTVVLPARADIAQRRVSVLAPLGTALLGCRVGDVIEWHMPGGLRRLRIEAVRHGPDPNARLGPEAA